MARLKNPAKRSSWRSPLVFIIPALLIMVCVAMLKRGDQEIGIKIEGANLQRILKHWRDAGRPQTFNIEDYIVGQGPKYSKVEQVFIVNGVSYRAVFSAESPRFVETGTLFITDTGELFWKDAEGRIRPASKR